METQNPNRVMSFAYAMRFLFIYFKFSEIIFRNKIEIVF